MPDRQFVETISIYSNLKAPKNIHSKPSLKLYFLSVFFLRLNWGRFRVWSKINARNCGCKTADPIFSMRHVQAATWIISLEKRRQSRVRLFIPILSLISNIVLAPLIVFRISEFCSTKKRGAKMLLNRCETRG